MNISKRQDIEFSFDINKISVMEKNEEKTILQSLSGSFTSGRLVGILGASGCGKTTLLGALSGRMSRASVGAKGVFDLVVKINGQTIDPKKEMSRIAYVMSDDVLRSASTCLENLRFCAALRLTDMDAQGRSQTIERLLDTLGLQECQNTMIGSHTKKGLSSGERKRTAIASDIIHTPAIIFLDEPTSALDSYTAYNVVQTLKKLCLEGCVVVCTVHQPSSEIFNTFDDCIFLSSGRCVYSGPVTELSANLASQNLLCPANYNVCDYLLFLSQTLDKDSKMELVDTAARTAQERSLLRYKNLENSQNTNIPPPPKRASFAEQLKQLLKLEWSCLRRDKVPVIARILISVAFCVVYGLIFFQTFVENSDQPSDIIANFGIIGILCLTNMMQHSMAGLLSFSRGKPLFKRETAKGLYTPLAFLLTQTLFEIPIGFVQTVVNVSILYFMAGLTGNFGLTILYLWMLGFASSSLSSFVSSAIEDMSIVGHVVNLINIPQIMFMGIFIPISKIPVALRWLRHIMPLNYALKIVAVNEFSDKPDDWKWFEEQSIEPDLFLQNIIIILSMIVVVRILTLICLQRSARDVVM